MTPVDALVTGEGELTLEAAERLMIERKVKKLPLVDRDGTLIGLITAKDIVKQERLPFATRDAHGRLRVGAAIGAKGDYLERAAELISAGVDVIVIDIAHGHSVVMARAIEAFRARFGDFELVAGNVATADGVHVSRRARRQRGEGRHRTRRRLHDAHHDELRRAADRGAGRVPPSPGRDGRIPLIADGGVRRHGAILEALLFGGDTVMLGSMFAGTEETPGEVVQKSVCCPTRSARSRCRSRCCAAWRRFRRFAIGSTSRTPTTSTSKRSAPKGTEVSVPARGSVRPIVQDILRHLCSSISYGGATQPGGAEDAVLAGSVPLSDQAVGVRASRESYER